MIEQAQATRRLQVEARNAFLTMTAFAIISALAIMQMSVITSYDILLTSAGINNPGSLYYPSVVLLFIAAYALALWVRKSWTLLVKLRKGKV